VFIDSWTVVAFWEKLTGNQSKRKVATNMDRVAQALHSDASRVWIDGCVEVIEQVCQAFDVCRFGTLKIL
jgi:hypothetical protein